jgi:uncharacterized membrane protein
VLEPIELGVQALVRVYLGAEQAVEFAQYSWTVKLSALLGLIVGLYFLGRFLAFRLGRGVLHLFDRVVLRLPLVRNVYGSVKQVTDFLLREREEIEYRRVVAVEYPRKGIWSLGLVTGESMREVWNAAGQECLSVLIPSSPVPVTGYTINVARSEVLDLNMSVDQAFQFCISCGVVVPPHLLPNLGAARLPDSAAQALASSAGATQSRSAKTLSETSEKDR